VESIPPLDAATAGYSGGRAGEYTAKSDALGASSVSPSALRARDMAVSPHYLLAPDVLRGPLLPSLDRGSFDDTDDEGVDPGSFDDTDDEGVSRGSFDDFDDGTDGVGIGAAYGFASTEVFNMFREASIADMGFAAWRDWRLGSLELTVSVGRTSEFRSGHKWPSRSTQPLAVA